MKQMIQFQCTISKVIFCNENRYILGCTITACSDGTMIGRKISIVGNFFSAKEGDTYRITGSMYEDEAYGEQCRVIYAEFIYPNKISEIEDFLNRYTIGVGKKTIQKITDAYGINTLEKIIESTDNITKVGVGPIRALKLHNMILMHKSLERLGSARYTCRCRGA